jgi:hypothetical protein
MTQMTQMIDYPEKKNTIFTQAIDQNYENNKENIHNFSEENFENFLENGDLKLNFDFIENPDEFLITTKSQHKSSEGNLSNSCESSDSTEFDTLSVNRSKSETKLLSENKQNFKIKNFLSSNFDSDSSTNLSSEIQKLKENLKQETKNKIFFGNNDNKISNFANLPMGINPQNQNEINFSQNSQRQMNLICGNFPLGFFTPHVPKQNLNTMESSVFKKERKWSYQAPYTGSNFLEY